MKFADFREQKAIVAAEGPSWASDKPPTFNGAHLIQDWRCDPWDRESLDAMMCPHCGEDVKKRVGEHSDNVAFYQCVKVKEHRYARVFVNKFENTTRSTLQAASTVLAEQLTAARDKGVDGMGRPVD